MYLYLHMCSKMYVYIHIHNMYISILGNDMASGRLLFIHQFLLKKCAFWNGPVMFNACYVNLEPQSLGPVGPQDGKKLAKMWGSLSGWWFQRFFIFIPIWGRWTHFDEYFSKGLVQPPTSYRPDLFWWNMWSTHIGKMINEKYTNLWEFLSDMPGVNTAFIARLYSIVSHLHFMLCSLSWLNKARLLKFPALLGHIILDDFCIVFAFWSAAFEGHLHRILLCRKASSWSFCHLTLVLQGTLRLVRCQEDPVWIYLRNVVDIYVIDI